MNWLGFLLPLAIEIIKSYIVSTSTKSDDKVLDLVKEGVVYLAQKDNNTVNSLDAASILKKEIIK